jgi:O-antigen biosynthesis protein
MMYDYDEYWNYESKKNNNEYYLFKNNLISSLNIKNKKILDVGCGFGNKKLAENNSVLGIDISNIALKEAEKRYEKALKRDIEKGLRLKEKFDVIFLLDILEHIKNPEKLLRNCKNLIKKEGRIIINVPNSYNLFNRVIWIKNKKIDLTDRAHIHGLKESEHITRFSIEKIEKLIKNNNLKIIKKEYFFPNKTELKKIKKYEFILKTINYSKIYKIVPGSLSFSFFYVCKKN